MDREEAAQRMYKCSYDELSAWGKNAVDHAMARIEAISIPKENYSVTLPNTDTSLRLENERLGRIIEQLEIENAELWQENQELRIQRHYDTTS